jgi:hypothetical protein
MLPHDNVIVKRKMFPHAGPGQRNPNNWWNIGIGLSQVFTPTFTMSVNLGAMKWVEGNDMQGIVDSEHRRYQ